MEDSLPRAATGDAGVTVQPPGAGLVLGKGQQRDAYLFTCYVPASERDSVFLIVLNSVSFYFNDMLPF